MKNNPIHASEFFLSSLIEDFKLLVEKGEIFKSRGQSCKKKFNMAYNENDYQGIARSLYGNEHPEAVKLLNAIKKHLQPDCNDGESLDMSPPPAPESMAEETDAHSNKVVATPLPTFPVSSISPPSMKQQPDPDENTDTSHLKAAVTAPMENLATFPAKDPTVSAQPAPNEDLPGVAGMPEEMGKQPTETIEESKPEKKTEGTEPALDGKKLSLDRDNIQEPVPKDSNISDSRTGTECKLRIMKPSEFMQDEGRFMFDTSETHRGKIFKSIQEIGFDHQYPLFAGILPDGRVVLYDGNTRYEEGVKAGVKEYPVLLRKFKNIEEIRLAGLMVQLGRRNTSNRDKMRIISEMERVAREKAREYQGRHHDTTSGSRDPEVSESVHANKWLASQLDISEATVKRLKKIIGSKYEEPYAKGEIGAREAYESILSEEKAADVNENMANENNKDAGQPGTAAPPQAELTIIHEQSPLVVEPQAANLTGEQNMSQPEILADKVAQKAHKGIDLPAAENKAITKKQRSKSASKLKDEVGAGQASSQLTTQKGKPVQNPVSVRTPVYNGDLPVPVVNLLAAMAKHIPDAAIPEIRELLSKCDSETINLIEQHLVRSI